MEENGHEEQPHTHTAKQNKPMIHIGFAVKSSTKDIPTPQQIPNGPGLQDPNLPPYWSRPTMKTNNKTPAQSIHQQQRHHTRQKNKHRTKHTAHKSRVSAC